MPGRSVITMVSFATESNDCMRAHKVGTFNPARLPCTRSIGASGPFRKTKASPQRFRLDFGGAVHSSYNAGIVGVRELDWAAGNRQVLTSWICITVDNTNSRTGRLAPVPGLF